jgi:hypothetical protein
VRAVAAQLASVDQPFCSDHENLVTTLIVRDLMRDLVTLDRQTASAQKATARADLD